MPKIKKMGAGTELSNFGPQPQDPTRSVVTMNNPQDQSIYSNPITTNQAMRSPSGLQVGGLPNMQLPQNQTGLNSIVSPNSLPSSKPPESLGINPL